MTEVAEKPLWFGSPIRRKEDPRLLRGEGRYIADLKLHGMTHAAVLRSQHAHARILGIDLSAARGDPRLLDVLVGADVADLPHVLCIDAEESTRPFTQPLLAGEKVRYVGEPIAIVVVEGDRYDAEDVLALIDVDYEPLPAVTDAEAAMREDATLLHDTTNVCDVLEYATGDVSAVDRAPHRLKCRFTTQDTRACRSRPAAAWSTTTLAAISSRYELRLRRHTV